MLRRWVGVVTLGLSGMWREGQRQGVEGLTGKRRRQAGRNEEWTWEVCLWEGPMSTEEVMKSCKVSMISIFSQNVSNDNVSA